MKQQRRRTNEGTTHVDTKASEIMVANTCPKKEAAQFSRVKAAPLLTGITLPLLPQLLLPPVVSGRQIKDASSSSFIFTKS